MATKKKDLGGLAFDFDSHVVEPETVWTEYLEPDYRVPARSAFWRSSTDLGVETILNGRLVDEPASGWLPRAGLWRPGLDWDAIGQLAPEDLAVLTPGAADPNARLADMDTMGVGRAVVFPTSFGEYLPLVDSPDVAAALARAYNNWAHDFASADRARLLPAAVLPVQSVPAARRELRRVVDLGFRVVMLRPVYAGGRFLTHPSVEPLWRDIESSGVVAAVHPYPGTANPEWSSHGPFVEKVSAKGSLPIGHPIAEAIAPLMDASTFLIGFMFYGFLERFPDLRMVLAHSRATWLPVILEKIEGYLTIGFGTSFPVRVDADHVFYEHGNAMITFDADEQMLCAMPDTFAPVAVWGSRYPNHDAMSAHEARDRLERGGVPPDVVASLMSSNADRLLSMEPVGAARA